MGECEAAPIDARVGGGFCFMMVDVSFDVAGFTAYLERRGLAEGTVELYTSHVEQDGGGLDRLRARSLAPKTRRLILGAFRAYGRYLKSKPATAKKGDALLAELSDIKLPAPVRKRVQKPLPRAVFDALREQIDTSPSIDDPMRVELGIMANRGIRRGDVLRLDKKTAASALKTGTMSYEVKGGRFLEFGVISTYRRYLELLVDVWQPKAVTLSDLIAPSEKSAKLRIGRALRRVAREIDVEVDQEDVRPHVLRRTYATLFYEACGRDVRALMKHMQWQQLQTAYSYIDYIEHEHLDDVAEQMLE